MLFATIPTVHHFMFCFVLEYITYFLFCFFEKISFWVKYIFHQRKLKLGKNLNLSHKILMYYYELSFLYFEIHALIGCNLCQMTLISFNYKCSQLFLKTIISRILLQNCATKFFFQQLPIILKEFVYMHILHTSKRCLTFWSSFHSFSSMTSLIVQLTISVQDWPKIFSF